MKGQPLSVHGTSLSAAIDNRPTEKGLERAIILAISHSGARYDHVI